MAVKTCPKCREDNPSTAVICINCGASLSQSKAVGESQKEQEQNQQTQTAPTAKKGKRLLFILILALLVLCAVIAIINTARYT